MAGDLFEPTPEEVSDAWDLFGRKKSGDAAVIDLTSFAIMSRVGISEAFTNDKHFAAAGFKLLF